MKNKGRIIRMLFCALLFIHAARGEDIEKSALINFTENRCGVEYCGVKDKNTGVIILKRQGRYMAPYGENGIYLYEAINGLWGYANQFGEDIPATYDIAFGFEDGCALVRKVGPEKNTYLINEGGKTIAELPYLNTIIDRELGLYWTDRIFLAKVEGRQGYYIIDRQGKILSDERFLVCYGDRRRDDRQLNPACREDGEWIYIDDEANCILADEWEDAGRFWESHDDYSRRAWVKKGGLWGVIDEDGRYVIPPTYSKVAKDTDVVYNNGSMYCIKSNGELVEWIEACFPTSF